MQSPKYRRQFVFGFDVLYSNIRQQVTRHPYTEMLRTVQNSSSLFFPSTVISVTEGLSAPYTLPLYKARENQPSSLDGDVLTVINNGVVLCIHRMAEFSRWNDLLRSSV